MRYTTIAETYREYRSKWERQDKYERGIVRSVPERAIVACSETVGEIGNSDRWNPG